MPAPGAVIDGRYRLIDAIDAGPGWQRFTAVRADGGDAGFIRLWSPARGRDREWVRRFLAAARRATRLHSRFAVRVTGCGLDHAAALPYALTEAREGPPLRELIVGGACRDPARAAALAGQVARCLVDSQAAEVLHGALGVEAVRVVDDGPPPGVGSATGPGPWLCVADWDLGAAAQADAGTRRRRGDDIQADLGAFADLCAACLTGDPGERAGALAGLDHGEAWGHLLASLTATEPGRRLWRADAAATILSAVASGKAVNAQGLLAGARPPAEVVTAALGVDVAAMLSAGEARAQGRAGRLWRKVRLPLAILGLVAGIGLLLARVTAQLSAVVGGRAAPVGGVLQPLPSDDVERR